MRLAEQPLTKVTINLFSADVEFLQARPGNWTVEARQAVHAYVQQLRRKASLRSTPLMKDEYDV